MASSEVFSIFSKHVCWLENSLLNMPSNFASRSLDWAWTWSPTACTLLSKVLKRESVAACCPSTLSWSNLRCHLACHFLSRNLPSFPAASAPPHGQHIMLFLFAIIFEGFTQCFSINLLLPFSICHLVPFFISSAILLWNKVWHSCLVIFSCSWSWCDAGHEPHAFSWHFGTVANAENTFLWNWTQISVCWIKQQVHSHSFLVMPAAENLVASFMTSSSVRLLMTFLKAYTSNFLLTVGTPKSDGVKHSSCSLFLLLTLDPCLSGWSWPFILFFSAFISFSCSSTCFGSFILLLFSSSSSSWNCDFSGFFHPAAASLFSNFAFCKGVILLSSSGAMTIPFSDSYPFFSSLANLSYRSECWSSNFAHQWHWNLSHFVQSYWVDKTLIKNDKKLIKKNW